MDKVDTGYVIIVLTMILALTIVILGRVWGCLKDRLRRNDIVSLLRYLHGENSISSNALAGWN